MSYRRSSRTSRYNSPNLGLVKRDFTWSEYVGLADEYQSPNDPTGSFYGDPNTGGTTYKQARVMAVETGYKAVMTEVDRLVDQLDQLVTTDRNMTTFDRAFDVSGYEVDIDRYLTGEPECMIQAVPVQVKAKGRAVRITINCGYLGDVENKAVLRRGAAVIALVDILSRMQHPLEIYTVRVGHYYEGSRLVYRVKVQDANEPLDIGRVMFALAHPAYHRRLCFQAMGIDGKGYHNTGGSQDVQEGDLEPLGHGTEIVLGSSLKASEAWSVEDCVRWIEAQLDKVMAD